MQVLNRIPNFISMGSSVSTRLFNIHRQASCFIGRGAMTPRRYDPNVMITVLDTTATNSSGRNHQKNEFRLFGSKRGIPTNPLGKIDIYDDQDAITDIDHESLRETIQKISKIVGYETYDVTLLLVEDDEMRETNLESRGIDAPTDILSFPFHMPIEPGLLEEPQFDIPDYYTLGDMVVDIPYVIRRCKEDTADAEKFQEQQSDGDDDDEEVLERGVSGAMAPINDPIQRIHMLLIHGMLHLVGYDHEDDDEYLEMVQKEEEILKELGYI